MTPILAVCLTEDEILAITATLGLERLPGLTQVEDDVADAPALAAAGRRSLCARGLAEVEGEELVAGQPLALLVEVLAAAERRLAVLDPGIDGAVATLSVTSTTVVLHRRTGSGVHEVSLLRRPAADELVRTMLSRYDGRVSDDPEAAPGPESTGALAALRLHNTDPADLHMQELALWVGADGTVVRISDDEDEPLEAVTGAGTAMSRSLLYA